MQGPRIPAEKELSHVLDFLNKTLRNGSNWSISAEYPTALTSSNLHNIRIITENEQIVSHAVLKPLIIKSPYLIYKVGAIGSVVTDESHRSQGLSTQILNNCIEEAKNQSCDIAILWTSLFDFYRKLGFELAGTEISLVIDENTKLPETPELRYSSDPRVSPEALYRLYSQHSVNTVRSIDEMKKFLAIPNTKVYTAWEPNGQLAAFAIEGKGADLTGYLHEWGGGVSKLLGLFNFIRKTQPNHSFTVITPRHAQNLITQLQTAGALYNEGFLGMIKILNFDQLATKIKRAFRAEGVADIVLERTPAGILFGIGTELFTLSDQSDIIRFIFGPVDIHALDMFSETAKLKLAKILPLPLWVWGWDSI